MLTYSFCNRFLFKVDNIDVLFRRDSFFFLLAVTLHLFACGVLRERGLIRSWADGVQAHYAWL